MGHLRYPIPRTTRRMVVAAVAVVILAACQEVRHDRLVIEPTGFECWVPAPMTMNMPQPRQTLEEAVLGPAGRPFSLTIDFLAVGGLPDCRLPGVVSWCMQHDCKPIASVRKCLNLDPSPRVAQGLDLKDAVRTELARLAGTPVTSDAPLDPVVIRAIAAGDSCDALADVRSQPRMVFGCAYSCPLELGTRDGDVTLDLDFLPRGPGDQDCFALLNGCQSLESLHGP